MRRWRRPEAARPCARTCHWCVRPARPSCLPARLHLLARSRARWCLRALTRGGPPALRRWASSAACAPATCARARCPPAACGACWARGPTAACSSSRTGRPRPSPPCRCARAAVHMRAVPRALRGGADRAAGRHAGGRGAGQGALPRARRLRAAGRARAAAGERRARPCAARGRATCGAQRPADERAEKLQVFCKTVSQPTLVACTPVPLAEVRGGELHCRRLLLALLRSAEAAWVQLLKRPDMQPRPGKESEGACRPSLTVVALLLVRAAACTACARGSVRAADRAALRGPQTE